MKRLPDYKKIYIDMITMKYPEKINLCETILQKEQMNVLDIIRLNNLLLGSPSEEITKSNQKLKSYDRATIFEILEYQSKHRLNNSQLAGHFMLSRNTVTKWKKMFFSHGIKKKN